jgi:hypothetical protein
MSSSFTPKTTTNLALSAPDTEAEILLVLLDSLSQWTVFLGVHQSRSYLVSIYVLLNYLESKRTLTRLSKVIPFESFRRNVIHSHQNPVACMVFTLPTCHWSTLLSGFGAQFNALVFFAEGISLVPKPGNHALRRQDCEWCHERRNSRRLCP